MRNSGLHLKIGDRVDYHSVIGKEITSKGHTVEIIQHINSDPESRIVAWITDHTGCVALEALSRSKDESDRIVDSSAIAPYVKHLTNTVVEMSVYTELNGEHIASLLQLLADIERVYL